MSYFTSCPHHRVLHSFPTRRSSDLWSSQTAFHCYSPRNSGLTPERLRKPLNRLRQPPADLRATTALPGSTAGGMSDVDRKSTRLNSSHTVISYAVFCLKKKRPHTDI